MVDGVQARLPAGQGEETAHAAAAGSVVGAVIPHDFTADAAAAGLKTGTAAGEREGTRGGEIHMIAAVIDTVARPVVARGYAHRDAHRGRRLKCVVHGRHCLRRPRRLGTTPADGD